MNRWMKYFGIVTMTLMLAHGAHAQRGQGEAVGLARQGAKPELVEISGTLVKVETGPCGRTTGRSVVGTHLFIEQEGGVLINLHIGAADAVQPFVDTLEKGQPLEAVAFRTDLMDERHYVAKTLRSGEETLEVRHEDLSPFWAQQRQERRRQRDEHRLEHRRMERRGRMDNR